MKKILVLTVVMVFLSLSGLTSVMAQEKQKAPTTTKKVETTTETKKVKTVKSTKKAASKCDDCKDKDNCTKPEKK